MTYDPKSVRIVFLGTPEFAACSLEKLIAEKYNVVAVITAPDKPAGRGQEIRQSEVKQVAVKHSIPVLQPEKLKSPEFLDELRSFAPELMIVVAFRMLPEAVWALPKMGTFNLHGSLLPQYRGAAPINRAVMNGEKLTGVTTFLLKQEIDTGNILLRKEIPIGENETAGELHDRMMVTGADLVIATVDALAAGTIQPVDQSRFVREGEILKDAPKLFRDTCRIDWSWPGERIRNHVRGLNPFPAAWSDLRRADGSVLSMKIFRCSFVPGQPFGKPGTINEQFHVAVADGMIRVEEIQAPGKKRMNISEFLKGFRVTAEESFV